MTAHFLTGHKRRPRTAAAGGFTLIEILLGLALIGMLAGGVFAVQRGAMQVSAEVVKSETQTLKVHSFCELLRRNFEQMPGNSKVNLQFYGGSGSDMSEVAFTDYPLAFTWPGVSAGAKTVIFRTERSVGIGLQAAILYLDEEQAAEWQKGGTFDEGKILGRITIMDGISLLNWRFLDESKDEYVEDWPLTNTRRPTMVEMTLQFMDGSDPVKLIFWIPTMANPQQFTQFGNPAGGAGAGIPGGAIPGVGGPGGGKPGGGAQGGGRPGGGRPGGGRPDAGASGGLAPGGGRPGGASGGGRPPGGGGGR